jgi:uncharacterized integral membrane protein (TIGR00698 family)
MNLSIPSLKETTADLLPGLLLTSALALLATNLQKLPGINIFSPLILAVLIGVSIRNTVGVRSVYKLGITFSLKKVLRLAVTLLGLKLSFVQVVSVGPIGLAIVLVSLVSAFAFTTWFGAYLGVDRKLAQLIAAGTSICGASAVLATNGIVKATDEDAAYAVTIVTLFGTLSMLLYPVLDLIFQTSPREFGLWCGVSIHDVAQVVAAASQKGQESGEIATISKLSRVLFLIPLLLGLGTLSTNQPTLSKRPRQKKAAKLPIPWFVFGFIALVILNSFSVFPSALKEIVTQTNQFLLTLSLGAMGLETNLAKMKETGLKPLFLGAASWLFISVFSLGLITIFYK